MDDNKKLDDILNFFQPRKIAGLDFGCGDFDFDNE
jgi:hypothetical protein